MDASVAPRTSDYADQHRLLDHYVRGGGRHSSVASLRRYFTQDDTTGGLYTGRWFERLEGGGDLPAVRDRVTSADVLSLTCLSIDRGLAGVAIDTTITHAETIAGLLRAIPTDVPMHEAPWVTYAPGSPVHRLWYLFCQCGGRHRSTTASKLLARKRPQLVPVYDSQVRALLGAPDSIWACLWTWFDADPGRVDALAELRSETGDIDDISLLRCLDVALWMRSAPELAQPETALTA